MKEMIILWFTHIYNKCNRVTVENYPNSCDIIYALATNYANKIKRYDGEGIIYFNLVKIQKVCAKVTSQNLSRKITIIKRICVRNIKFIKGFEL